MFVVDVLRQLRDHLGVRLALEHVTFLLLHVHTGSHTGSASVKIKLHCGTSAEGLEICSQVRKHSSKTHQKRLDVLVVGDDAVVNHHELCNRYHFVKRDAHQHTIVQFCEEVMRQNWISEDGQRLWDAGSGPVLQFPVRVCSCWRSPHDAVRVVLVWC